jgi:hypothetical protein
VIPIDDMGVRGRGCLAGGGKIVGTSLELLIEGLFELHYGLLFDLARLMRKCTEVV